MNFIEFLDQVEAHEELLPNEALVIAKEMHSKAMFDIKAFEVETDEDNPGAITLWVHIEEV